MLPPSRIRRRAGAGCIGCLGQLVVGVAVGIAVVIAIAWVFTPWAFYLGGKFHPVPVWQGIARVHASSGDYVLYLWFSPARGSRLTNLPAFSGWGSLCTPKGERFPMRVNASLFEHPGRDTNGKEMRIELYNRPWYRAWVGTWDRRPRLELRGRWQNPDLVTTDGGTLSVAFLPDGRLYDGPARNQPTARETLPVVFHEVPWTTLFGDCRATRASP